MQIHKMLTCLQIFIITKVKSESKKNCLQNNFHLICKHHLGLSKNNISVFSRNNISVLELRYLEWKILDFNNIIELFPNLKNLTVYKGDITQLYPPMKTIKLQTLSLKHLKIKTIPENFLQNFTELKSFNLEGNLLEEFPANISFGSTSEIYLSETCVRKIPATIWTRTPNITNSIKSKIWKSNKWNCSKNISWIFKFEDIIKDGDTIMCRGYTYLDKPLLAIARFKQTLQQECPSSCTCLLAHVVQNLNSSNLHPVIEVHCSEKGLTELPKIIPSKTMILHLENNDISSLLTLKTNPLYRSVIDLYLDNNTIKSIEELEGSYWFTHFRVLSLSGNKLTELPSYALDNALGRNKNAYAVQLSLGGNPWRCDCVFTPVFQELLQKYAPNIKDIREVKCSYVEGDENSLLPILDLTRSSVCRYPSEYTVQEALDLLNGVLASLIVFVLGKLAYDYYHFKKTGRLPWIVTKIP